MSLLAIGTMAFDNVETPFGKAEMIIGGACTYIAWTSSYFIDETHVVAVVGEDFPPSELEQLKKRGVNIDGVEIKKGEKSFFWAGKYHANMNSRDTLDTQLNVLADFKPILPPKARRAEYVMLGNMAPDLQLSVLDQMEIEPKLIALDTMNFWMDIAMDGLKKVLSRVNLITINDEEARQLSGEHSLLKAAKAIQKMGPEYLIIKKGEHGAMLIAGEDIFIAPGLPLEEVFDPTGAGDTFAGGFMGYLAKTNDISFENMKRAVIYGSTMASFCVEKFGIQRLKELDEILIELRVQEFKNISQFSL